MVMLLAKLEFFTQLLQSMATSLFRRMGGHPMRWADLVPGIAL
jgi:hypothetical protein